MLPPHLLEMMMRNTVLIAAVLAALGLVMYMGYERHSRDDVAVATKSNGGIETNNDPAHSVQAALPKAAAVDTQSLAAIYNAEDVTAQENLSLSAQGALKLDASLLHRYGLELCSYLSGTKYRSFVDQVSSSKTTSPQDIASARTLDSYRLRYCSKGVDASELSSHDYIDVALAEAAAAGDTDARVLLDSMAQVSQESGIDTISRDAVEERLTKVLRDTTSPAMFMQSATMLLDLTFDNWRPSGFEAGGANQDDLALAKQFGVQIAACTEFGICGPRSVYTLRACMPAQCDPQRGMDGYLQRKLSKDQYFLASKYAAALRAMRTNG